MHWRSRLIHPTAQAPAGFRSLATPTARGSTVVFERQSAIIDDWRHPEAGYSYGVHGTPTVLQLAAQLAELEGAYRTFVVPGGLAAVSLIHLALCSAGSHALVPRNAYGPTLALGPGLLQRLGVEVEPYDPGIGAGIAGLIRDHTALIWTESPGSHTMEIQDVPAIVTAAHARGVPVALDNTWSAGVLFDAFGFGVDVSMQALTKYVGGHSDLVLGSVSVANVALYDRIGTTLKQLGMSASPDDAALALRGLQTLGARLAQLEASTLKVAHWLAAHPAIAAVFHPALPSCPGHALWQRDFSGSSSLFSIAFQPEFPAAAVEAFVDGLTLFKIGFSWGGVTSLALQVRIPQRPDADLGGRLVRLNIGLEDPDDLIADLARAISAMR